MLGRMRTSVLVRVVLAAALVAGATASAAAQSKPAVQRVPNSPGTAVLKFYTALLKLKVTGLPTPKQRPALNPFLHEGLRTLLDGAQREQDAFIRANPGEKPPWIEGDLFSSLFEGPQSFELGQTSIVERHAEVPITFTSVADGKTTTWTDVVVLAKSSGAWKIWDVRYNATWDFKPGTNLRAVLGAQDAR